MKIQIQNIEINYEQNQTNRVPILFVHGWGGTLYSLKPLGTLFENNYKTNYIDLPGFGDSQNPPKNWGTQEYSNLVVEYISRLELKDLIYVGHSFGGSIGIEIASKHPQLISKLVLIAPSFKREANNKRIQNAHYQKYKNLLWPLRKVYYKLRYPHSEALRFRHLESNFNKILNYDLTPNVKSIKAPTLLLWGKEDTATKVEHANLFKNEKPDTVIKLFDNIGHNLPLVEPQKVAQEIYNFL